MGTKRILLVEDNPIDQSIAQAALRGHALSLAPTLQKAREVLKGEDIALIILDVNLPDGNGFRFFEELLKARANFDIPVIFLTSHSDVGERVFGLNLGAQDYICKPADPAELQVRVEARLRAVASSQLVGSVKKGDLYFNLSLRQASILRANEEPIRLDLTTLEFNVLYYFARNEGQALSRDKLLEEVWGRKPDATDRSVDSLISGLRKKMSPSMYHLKSVYGSGYSLTLKVESEEAA